MIPNFSNVHNKFKLNKEYINHTQLKEVAYSFVKEGKPFEKIIGDFLLDWLDNKDYILIKTSGSTGYPKTISLKKQAMVNSAIATGNYFNLLPGSTALHCLPTDFIAGKMMLIRAIILGLEIDAKEPTSSPLEGLDKNYNFCAMVPLQLQNSLSELHKIKTLIVGGAHVSNSLQEKLKDTSAKIFATYGMTETVSHIAVKKLNFQGDKALRDAQNSYYQALSNIKISQDNRDCLVIEAPKLSAEAIITNDIVKLHSETEFEILGRIDNVINSGGVKLFPEQIEAKLSGKIKQRFFIASKGDENLGDKLILILEGDSTVLENGALDGLDEYEVPKQCYAIKHFKETSSGKIKRIETLELLT